MELTKRRKTIKYFVYAGLLLLTALLQNVGGLFPEIFGARCFLLVPVCVLLGINEDERLAAVYGLAGGLLWDMVSAQHMGFNCIYLMFICYFASALVTYVFRNTFLTGLISAFAAVILYCLMYWLFFVLIASRDGAGRALVRFYLPCMIYTAAATPLIQTFLIFIKSKVTGERQLDG